MTPKPQPSAAVKKAPKDTDIGELKGLKDKELDYHDDMNEDDDGNKPDKPQQTPKQEGSQDTEQSPVWSCHQSGDGSTECV